MNIPGMNLEMFSCPNYNMLRHTIVEPLPSCGFHLDESIHRCPMTECHAFWLWMETYVK